MPYSLINMRTGGSGDSRPTRVPVERAGARQSREAWGGPCQLGWGADTGIAGKTVR